MTFESQLRDCGLKFKLEGRWASGGFELEDGRTHIFRIDVQGNDELGRTEHDLLLRLGPAKDPARVMLLCKTAGGLPRGGIVVIDGWAYYKVELPSAVKGDLLYREINTHAVIADGLEQVVFGSDDS
jgi:hypothetical protein